MHSHATAGIFAVEVKEKMHSEFVLTDLKIKMKHLQKKKKKKKKFNKFDKHLFTNKMKIMSVR